MSNSKIITIFAKQNLKIMKTKKEIAENQIRIQQEMQNAGFNIVTCGNCGSILLHEIEDETIECLCGHDMDLSDCPDLWYEGCQNNDEFKED